MDNQENNSFVSEDLEEDVEIIGISFRGSGKVYYFGANGNTAREGEHAIVETARGVEYGKVSLTNTYVKRKTLVLPLKNVIRIANKNDDLRFEANREREKEAFAVCQKKIAEHKLDMKLIDVEYTFDNSKLLFYFTSDDRVDFRELVKDLAGYFRTRIELRQIGIRDEAKIMGGLGICGRPFCCSTFLPDFVQVSIKMAKEQNLSLNSAKISGACGRLMCCLRYEYDTYQEALRRMPKNDTPVETPDGPGVVTEVKPLEGIVKVRLNNENEKQPKSYPLDLLRPADKKSAEAGDMVRESVGKEKGAAGGKRIGDAGKGAEASAALTPDKTAERSAEAPEDAPGIPDLKGNRTAPGQGSSPFKENAARGRSKNRRGRGKPGARESGRPEKNGEENARPQAQGEKSAADRDKGGNYGRSGEPTGGKKAQTRPARPGEDKKEGRERGSRSDREKKSGRNPAAPAKTAERGEPSGNRAASDSAVKENIEKQDAVKENAGRESGAKEEGRMNYAPLPSNSVRRGSRNRWSRPSVSGDKSGQNGKGDKNEK